MVRLEAKLRRQARDIFRAALKAADPVDSVVRNLRRLNVDRYRNIYVIGAGKAGASMAVGAERVLGRRIARGLINVKDGYVAKLRRIELNECGHPIPDARGVEGARRIAEIAEQAGADDLVICLMSGGGSALMPLPAVPVTLEDKQATTKLLLACGADIREINAVRKHSSRIKGGQLARLAYPATVVTLMLSDVIGDDLGVIGSGPTAPDASTFAQVKDTFDKYDLWGRVPASIRQRMEAGLAGEIPETPKPGEAVFARTRNIIVGSNDLAVRAAAARARALGFRTLVLSTLVEGETREVARMHAAIVKELVRSGRPVRPPACIITGGETTVTIKGDGLGGRNQEFVLAAALDIAELENVVILSGGTDGSDGPTDAAGAIADGQTLARLPSARKFLANNDSYRYFERLGDLLITGPTNTNVMDVRIMLAAPAAPPYKPRRPSSPSRRAITP